MQVIGQYGIRKRLELNQTFKYHQSTVYYLSVLRDNQKIYFDHAYLTVAVMVLRYHKIHQIETCFTRYNTE